MTWQPIETAPKDGTRFLAFSPPDNVASYTHDEIREYGEVMIIEWDFCHNCWHGDAEGSEGGYYTGENGNPSVSHWMPLPGPP